MKHSYLSAGIAFVVGILFVVSSARGDITTGLIGQWELNDGSGSSNAVDSSGNNFTGMLTGFSDTNYTTMWTPDGKFGEGLLFNANGDTNDYVSIPNESSFDFNTGRELTIAAWVNCSVPGSAESNGAAIMCKGANGQEQYCLYISNGVFASIIRNSAGTGMQIINSSVSPAANTWYHVAMVWGDTPQINNIYIDGQFNSTKTGSGFTTSELTTSDPLTIGAKEPGTVNASIPFEGIINDVRLYSRVLTSADIFQLYTNGATAANVPSISTQPRGVSGYLGDSPVFSVAINSSTTLLPVGYQWQLDGSNVVGATASSLTVSNAQATNAGTYTVVITNSEGATVSSNAVLALQSLPAADTNTGLVGYWKFDDGSGSPTAADSSGNGNTGALVGFNDPTFTTMWTNGLFGGALEFNSDGQATNVVAMPNVGEPAPATLDFSTIPTFSLSAWVMGGPAQTNGAAIIAKGTGGGGEQYTLDIFGGNYRFYVRDTNATVYTAQTAVGPGGSWQHVAAVLNASSGIMNCYVNGELAAVAVAPFSLLTNSHEVSIGNRQLKAAAYGEAFTGTLDDVRIYNRDLTSADVFALYSSKPAPLTINWQATNYDVVTGSELQFAPVVTGGVPPFSYQWQQNGTNIAGATTYPFVISNVPASAAGSYDLVVSDSNIVPAVTSGMVTVTMEPYLTFNSNGVSWANKGSAQPSAIWLGTNLAQLTTVGSDQSNSIFYLFPQEVGQFQASFNYQMAAIPGGSTGPGDGLVFCIQNDPRGIAAIGQDATGLGVGDVTGGNLAISPSVEFEINVNSGSASTGISWDANGALGPSLNTSPLALDGGNSSPGHLINVQLTYYDGVATAILTDTNAGTEFSFSTNLNIPSVLGTSVGYVGFTAATGSASGEQQVSDFTYKNVISPVFTRQPISSTNISSGGALTVSAAVIGSAPISYQWLDQNNNPVPGETNAALSIASLSTNNTFTLEAYNPYGTNFSGEVSVTVVSGAPQLEQDITSTTAVVGSTVVLSALFQGTLPITYGWQSNGVAIADGGRVSGANTSALTISNVQ
ncbi:MAG TPA: LamG-like jellyroll fold domain-containing protein, partial [Verrucomicrobiae bacterium]|nr:LamG-like jellyroll fold domain-containing protein [Verrucomicrobiae bacterium]